MLEAPDDTERLVLEMAMRGAGQIAELAAIAEPEVAVITNVGPVHVELLGSVAAIAAAKAEVIDCLPADGTAVVPVEAGELEPHLARAPRLLRFGPGGDVEAVEAQVSDGVTEALVATPVGEASASASPSPRPTTSTNALAAIAGGVALGAPLEEMAVRAADIGFSRFRGERVELGDGIVLVNDCYNANPVSMRAALDHLATLEAPRTVAVLGEMGELGPEAGRVPPRGRRPRPRRRDRPRGRRRRGRPANMTPTNWSPIPARRRSARRPRSSRATRSWSRARARSGWRRSRRSSLVRASRSTAGSL